MPDIEAYNQTALDVESIRGLAVRAAAETPLRQAPAVGYVDENQQFIDVCGPHWLLDARTERVDEVRNGLGEDGTYTWLFVLMPDGQLKRVLIRSLYTYRTEGTWSKREHTHSVDPMSDSEIESFDFAKGSYNFDNDYGRIWGNAFREGGASQQKLLHASRGAGLSLLLDNIRTGRAHQDDGGVVPFREETAETRTQHLPRLTEFHYTPDQRAEQLGTAEEQRREQETRRNEEKTSLRPTYKQVRWKASAVAVLVAVLAIWLHSGRSEHPMPQNGARVEDRSESVTEQGVQGSGQLDTADTDLGLAIPMSYPDCDDSGIVVIGNVTPPKERWRDAAAPIQRMLEDNPGASYLRTDRSCPSLRQADDNGNPIYAVYRPAGRTESEVCAEVRAAGGDAYGKWLSTSKPASYMIPC